MIIAIAMPGTSTMCFGAIVPIRRNMGALYAAQWKVHANRS